MEEITLDQLMGAFVEHDNSSVKENIDYNEPYVSYLNISMNWYRLKNLCDKLTYSEIVRIYNQLLENENLIESIILVGSVSRGKYSKKSDIDIVVILRKSKQIKELTYVSSFRDINIVWETKNKFMKRYNKGYEFFVWCVKYGVVLFDKGFFNSIHLKSISPINKDEIINKRTYINKIIIKIYEALANKDKGLGIKYIEKMLIQSARIILISNDIVPKSKLELLEQLLEINSSFYDLYIKLNTLQNMNCKELTLFAEAVYQSINNYIEDYYR